MLAGGESAADDAYATMRVAQEMCEHGGCTVPELLQKYGIRLGRIANGQYSGCVSQRRSEYLAEKRRQKRERGERRSKFNDFVYGYRVRPQSEELKGKKFSFSRCIEEEVPLAKGLVKEIVKRGGKYSLKLAGCNVFVTGEDDASPRAETARKLKDAGQIGEIYTLSELQQMLGAELPT